MISAEEFLSERGIRPSLFEDADSRSGAGRRRDIDGRSDAGSRNGGPTGFRRGWSAESKSGESDREGRDRQARDSDDAGACQEAALKLLDMAPRSEDTLRQRLQGKGYSNQAIETALANLERVGLVDDEKYAQGIVESCLNRCMGRRGAFMELKRRGIREAEAKKALDEAEERGAFHQAALDLGEQVAKRTRGFDRRTRLRRLWSAGGRKGHTSDDIREAAEAFLPREEDA